MFPDVSPFIVNSPGMKFMNYIKRWFSSLARVFAREWHLVLHDQGVLIFFILLPLMYPVAYTLIYNPEVVTDMPIAIIDHDHTAASRKLVRDASAAPTIAIYDYVPDMAAARDLMARGEVFGILEIPDDFGKKIGRMEPTHATFYAQTSLLLRYRGFMGAIADVQIKDISEITAARAATLGGAGSALSGVPIGNEAHMLGDVEQGFASFVMPGIVVLILQQSMVLGICMLGGTSRERRRRNGGIDPLNIPGAPVSAVVWGRTLCYTVCYIVPALYLLHFIPVMFGLPHFGNPVDYLLFIFPMLLASAFFGQTLNYFVTDRESTFIVIAFTSVIFLFLSGLTWPRYAMSGLWKGLGDVIPGVWGVAGFIRINSNDGTLFENMTPWLWMWGLTIFYFITSMIVFRVVARRETRLSRSTVTSQS